MVVNRPEKEHATQLRFYKELTELVGQKKASRWRLVLAGSVRNEGDEKRVQELKILADELDISVSDTCAEKIICF